MGIIEKIASAGIVGCGGAGFPTHKKLQGDIEYFIINGAECEPLLRTDRYLMRSKADELVRAAQAIGRELKIPHCVIAVKRHYEEEIAALRQAIERSGANIRIHELESFYPAGDEQTIVYEVTGRVVPPGGIPIAVGAVVDNVGTLCAVSDAMDGIPFTQKYLTVTGEVNRPVILQVPVGTSFRQCLELAGGTSRSDCFFVSGGPMMGKPIAPDQLDDQVVTKTTSGILALPGDGYHARVNAVELRRMLNRASSACIQCTSCTQLCPRHLLGHPLQPHKIMRKMALGPWGGDLLNDPDILNAQLCCECGVCESYACPMGLFPRKINNMLKQEMAAVKARRPAEDGPMQPSPYREERKAPSFRAAARVGVAKYYDYEIRDLVRGEPGRVEIPLKMHIGAPAEPVVAPGDHVEVGDLVARMSGDALGSPIHASIPGRVETVGERIVIVRG